MFPQLGQSHMTQYECECFHISYTVEAEGANMPYAIRQ